MHLFGYGLTKRFSQFRQRKGKTPGHPEYLDTECQGNSSGPLGQGMATVGLLWQKHI